MEPLPDRLPLVIGVTGHRDLRDQDIPRLEQAVAAIIAGLRRDYLGHGGETPIIVMSSLAEGADRLVARVALAHGARLVAPMPMPIEEYRRDFEPGLKPGNAAEFEALLAQAITAPVMPFASGNTLEAVRVDNAKRAEQYRAVGLFIAQHAGVLIALWDGDEGAKAAGGTTEVVAFKRHGIPLAVSGSARASLDGSEVGPVIHVVTPRQKATSAIDEVSVPHWGRAVIRRHSGGTLRRFADAISAFIANVLGREPPDGRSRLPDEKRRELEAWENFEALAALTRQFNREAATFAGADGQRAIEQSIDAMFTSVEPPVVSPASAKERALERGARWCRMYAIADALAQEWQKEFKRDWIAVYFCAFLAFLCFALFSQFTALSEFLLVLYVAGFAGIFVVVARAHVAQHQGRFLDYRALAEALRVAIYWRMLGIGSQDTADTSLFDTRGLGAIANAYPIKQSSELAWVKIALRVLELVDRGGGSDGQTGLDATAHAVARHYWVRGQYAFFRSRGYRFKRMTDIISTRGILLTVLAPFVIVPIVLGFTSPAPDGHDSTLRTVLLIVSGLLPGIAGIMNEYSERLALNAQARQYDRMRTLFERACDLLPETIDETTAPLAQAIYVELGQEAMTESAEWVAIYRQRPIQPPK